MIEKRTMWAVTRDFEIIERVAIIEDGKVLVSKNQKDSEYGTGWDILRYFDSEEIAKKWLEGEEKRVRGMVPKVREFINWMYFSYEIRKKLGIEEKEYLGSYAESDRSIYQQEYNDECDYAKKLEAFINSHILNIDGHMIPFDQVRDIQWYTSDCPDEFEADQWKAVLTTTSGDEYTTCSKEDVRLIWATFGHCAGSWFIDNDIDYNKDEED